MIDVENSLQIALYKRSSNANPKYCFVYVAIIGCYPVIIDFWDNFLEFVYSEHIYTFGYQYLSRFTIQRPLNY